MASVVAGPMPSLVATRVDTAPSRLPSSSSTFGHRTRARPSVRTYSFTQQDTQPRPAVRTHSLTQNEPQPPAQKTPERLRERTSQAPAASPNAFSRTSPGVMRSLSVPSGDLQRWRTASLAADRAPSCVAEEEAEGAEAMAVDTLTRDSVKGRLAAVLSDANDRQRAQQALDKDLLAASAKGRSGAVGRLLAESSANPNCVTRHGMTPLHYAAARGSADVVQLLLAAGADPLLLDSKGCTPLDFATSRGHGSVVLLLEEALCGRGVAALPSGYSDSSGASTWPRVKRERTAPSESHLYIHVSVKPGPMAGHFFAPYTTYIVTMTTRSPTMGRRTFTVRRRFNDFFTFYHCIMKECPNNDTRKRLEALEPKKTGLYRYLKATVEARAFLFEQILSEAAHETALLLFVVDFLSAE